MDQHFVDELKQKHVAAWNETDRTKRDQILREIYAPDIKMYDPEKIFQSLVEISDFIGQLHLNDPDFSFSEAKPAEFSQNGIRLFGIIATRENRPILNTMDFFIVENDKVAHLYVFMSPV